MPVPPLALFITWTCYGTWLPGDPRGYVSNTLLASGSFECKRNQPGSPYSRNDPGSLAAAKKAQRWDTVWLDAGQARTVAAAIQQAASERGWFILRAAVMANHVHSLTRNCPDNGPLVRRIFKGVSTARLSQMSGRPGRWWTQGGSDRYLHDQSAIDAVERYIREQSGILCGIINMQVVL